MWRNCLEAWNGTLFGNITPGPRRPIRTVSWRWPNMMRMGTV